jgi:HD-GYP domain-containing protein (c-di-GMP phosphodiesterase class II)
MASRIRIYVGTLLLIALAAAVAVYAMAPAFSWDFLRAAAVFATLSAVCEMMAWKKAARSESGSISFLPILASVIVAPHWLTVVAVATATVAVQLANRRILIKTVFNIVQTVLWVALTILVYTGLGGHTLLESARPNLLAFIAILIVFAIVNSGAVAGAIAISEGEKFFKLWSRRARVTVFFDLLTLPGVYVFAYCYLHWGALGAGFLVIPILIIRSLYKVNWELQQSNQELLQLMVAAIEARDPYTSGHSRRVSRNSRLIAEAIGLRDKQVERVAVAALLHDVGKIHEVFAPILSKPGRLTAEENAIMQTHPIKSEELVRMVSQLQDVVAPIRHHHENWDGTGYPDGLIAENIPIASRIIMFADTIDAMTTDRPYRAALTETQVRAEFVKLRGRQFDPSICDKLLTSPIYLKLFDQDVPLTPAIAGQERWKTPAPVPRLAS